eukprot:TRINITY_DN76042_c0_g1_i1.p1 TRINITY_DN76042_c0_g1~~TRINITY_DN76042_c0_g1_i1.p1  ORF type:complete len:796 (+),score=112.47 TRINITY_DN76042_c0_g1_i1:348-2390(+)
MPIAEEELDDAFQPSDTVDILRLDVVAYSDNPCMSSIADESDTVNQHTGGDLAAASCADTNPAADAHEENEIVDAWALRCDSLTERLRLLADSADRQTGDWLAAAQQVLDLASDAPCDDDGSDSHAIPPRLLHAVLRLLDTSDAVCTLKFSKCALELLQKSGAVERLSASSVETVYLNIAKILFKYSKTQHHDSDFMEAGLLKPLLDILRTHSPEHRSSDLMVFIIGILKNIAFDESNQKELVSSGAIPALFSLMDGDHFLDRTKETSLLIQVTATLRSLASDGHEEFLPENRLDLLTDTLERFSENAELLTNISRVLAKLSYFDSVCAEFETHKIYIQRITAALSDHVDEASLVLRLCFVLGTLTARNSSVCDKVAFYCQGAVLLQKLLSHYWQRERRLANVESGQEALKETDEVLVALTRLLGNMAISVDVGTTLASSSTIVDHLINILGAKRIADNEELVLNTVAAIANMSYHNVPSNLLISEHQELVCCLLRPLLLESFNVEALIETARALGNLSCHETSRLCIVEIRLDEVLTILLDHGDADLVYYSCGALVNLAADAVCRSRLLNACPIVEKLSKLIAEIPPGHDDLQRIAVQVLANLSIDRESMQTASGLESLRSMLPPLVNESNVRELALEILERLPSSKPGGPDDDDCALDKLPSSEFGVPHGDGAGDSES